MKAGHKRSILSVVLTRKFHFRYLGLWFILFTLLLATLNGILYLYLEERAGGYLSLDPVFHSEYVAARQAVLFAMFGEIAAFLMLFVALASFTAHRIAGPFIRLVHTFHNVRDGDMNTELHFREYDKLHELEQAFQEMMTALRERADEKQEPR